MGAGADSRHNAAPFRVCLAPSINRRLRAGPAALISAPALCSQSSLPPRRSGHSQHGALCQAGRQPSRHRVRWQLPVLELLRGHGACVRPPSGALAAASKASARRAFSPQHEQDHHLSAGCGGRCGSTTLSCPKASPLMPRMAHQHTATMARLLWSTTPAKAPVGWPCRPRCAFTAAVPLGTTSSDAACLGGVCRGLVDGGSAAGLQPSVHSGQHRQPHKLGAAIELLPREISIAELLCNRAAA